MLHTLLLVSVFMVAGVLGQSPFTGKCPKQDVVQNFDVNRYAGIWYENRNYFAIFQVGGDCVTATYSLQPNSDVVKVVNSQTILGFQNNITGTATITDPSKNEGKLSVAFFGQQADESNYWVLDTDYTSYTVVWSCQDRIFNLNTQFLWILTRERFPSAATIETALGVVRTRGLDESRLSLTTQNEDCPPPPPQENV